MLDSEFHPGSSFLIDDSATSLVFIIVVRRLKNAPFRNRIRKTQKNTTLMLIKIRITVTSANQRHFIFFTFTRCSPL